MMLYVSMSKEVLHLLVDFPFLFHPADQEFLEVEDVISASFSLDPQFLIIILDRVLELGLVGGVEALE